MKKQGLDNGALQALWDKGLALHRGGRLDEALLCYEQILAAHPAHFDALHMLGVIHIQSGQLERAVELIRRAVTINSRVAAAYGNLANALNVLGRHQEALSSCDRAIALNPQFTAAHGNRGQALFALGRPKDALASYSRVVALSPGSEAFFNQATMLRELGRLDEALASYDQAVVHQAGNAAAHRGRGVTLRELGRHREALASYDQAIALEPDYVEAYCERGMALRKLGRLEDALASHDRAVELRPGYADAYATRGNVLSDLQRYEEAISNYDEAIRLRPSYAEAFSNRAVPLRELQRAEDALASCDRAIALKPDDAEAHDTRGGALFDLRRLEEALASYDRAIALKPEHARALSNKGVVLTELLRLDEAMASFDRAVALEPESAEAHYMQAMCRLKLGQWTQGWRQHEWRWGTREFKPMRRDLGAPLWLGEEPLQDRRILVHAEQGLGDTLQFCRYAPALAARGVRVILEVPPSLERLLMRLDGLEQVVTRGGVLPPFDFQTPLMSLPLALGAQGPNAEAYLSADPEDVAAWARRLSPSAKLRVGLCWAGGVRPDQLVANAIDKRRSLSLGAFEPLGDLGDIEVYSLQKGPPAGQVEELRAAGWKGPPIIDLTTELKDFADTAALVANLDLVISCDTAIAHLAGGLGKPVWILNRFDACWRWLADRKDSPWYRGARLFRQPAPGDWDSVVAQVKGELQHAAHLRSSASTWIE